MRSGSSAGLGNLTPNGKGSLARGASAISSGGFGIGDVEEVRDLIVNRQEPLRLPSRFETLHDAFASPGRLMRILSPIVQAFMLAMIDVKAHLRPRSAVGSELVRDHDAGRRDRRFQEFRHELLRRAGVSAALDQDVENEIVLINGAPEPVLFAADRDDDLIHVPFVPASRRALADPIGERLAEFLSPLAHGLWVTQIPRAASISSTMRRLKGNRKYSQTP